MSTTFGPGTLYCAECGRPTASDELARFGDMLICPDCKNSFAQKLREGVTPAAAAAVQYGGFWIRVAAAIIDGIITGVVASVLQVALLGSLLTMPRVQPGVNPEAALGAMMGAFGLAYLIGTAIACGYEAFFVARLGATPGKMVFNLKVLRTNGARLSFGRAVGRYFAKLLSGLLLGIGYIMVGFDSEKRGLHDIICDSRVVKSQD